MGPQFPCFVAPAYRHSAPSLTIGGFSLLTNSKYVNFHIKKKKIDPVALYVWTEQNRTGV